VASGLDGAPLACPSLDPDRDACIHAGQVKAFVCPDNCRESWRTDPNTQSGLQSCKESFRACVRVCPRAQGQ